MLFASASTPVFSPKQQPLSIFCAPCGTFPSKSHYLNRAISQQLQWFMPFTNKWPNILHQRLHICINGFRMKETITEAVCIRINPSFQPKTPILFQCFALRAAPFPVKVTVVAELYLTNDNDSRNSPINGPITYIIGSAFVLMGFA